MNTKARLLRNWPLKLTSLLLSIVLWIVAAGEEPGTRVLSVILTVTPPPGRSAVWRPGNARVLAVGPGRELLKLAAAGVTISKAIPDTVRGRRVTLDLAPSDLELPRGINVRVQEIEPRQIEVELDSVFRRSVSVHPLVRIETDSGFALVGGIQVIPGAVTLTGPVDQVHRLDSVSTVVLRVTGADGAVERRIPIDTDGFGPLRVNPAEVTVNLDIVPVSERSYSGIPVDLPDETARSFSIDPERVKVRVRGALERLRGLLGDSIHVFIDPPRAGATGAIPLKVLVPAGFSATAQPDSVTLTRRGKQ